MSNSSPRRIGFTLVELLVVITIIGMLVALLLPAVNAARERMLTAQCLNDMMNVAKALVNYSSSKGTLPGYVQPMPRADKSYVVVDPGSTMGKASYSRSTVADASKMSRISWATRILPQLDRNDIYDRLVDMNTPNGDPVRPIAVYICPKDTDATSSPDNAGMSFVINTGAWDWNDSGIYVGDAVENGLCHNLVMGRTTTRIDNIKDGSGMTILLSENIHKNSNYSWLGVDGSVVPATAEYGGEQHFGMVWVVNVAPFTLSPTNVTQQVAFRQETAGGFNSDKPWYARPSSNHPAGAFNVLFADANGKSLAVDIDYEVYQALLTPNGSRCVDPLNPSATGGAIGTFRARPPLSEKDFE
jgi:prepilin-type N-terminal cleavage/methylation domain-containing protein